MKKLFSTVAASMLLYAVAAQSTDSWYKVFTGSIGNMPATLHLYKGGEQYGGYVWFTQNQWPMFIYYNVPVKKSDTTELSANSGPMSLQLAGLLSGNKFVGNSTLAKEGSAAKKAAFNLVENTTKTYTPLGFFAAEHNAKLPAQLKNESAYSSFTGTIWPTGNTPYYAALRKQISDWLRMKTPNGGPLAWIKTDGDRNVASWKNEITKMPPNEASQMGLSLSVQTDTRITVMYENEGSITLAKYNYAYTGGAHGLHATRLINLDKKTGRPIPLGNIITVAGMRVLPAMLDRVARLQYGVKNNGPLTRNGFQVDKIPVSKDFYLTSVGIGFIYAPYEIKSFADGEINLFVPFAALNNWLQPAYKK